MGNVLTNARAEGLGRAAVLQCCSARGEGEFSKETQTQKARAPKSLINTSIIFLKKYFQCPE